MRELLVIVLGFVLVVAIARAAESVRRFEMIRGHVATAVEEAH